MVGLWHWFKLENLLQNHSEPIDFPMKYEGVPYGRLGEFSEPPRGSHGPR